MTVLPKEDLSYSNSMLSKSKAFRNFQWDEGNFVFDYVRYDVAKGGHDIADYIDVSVRRVVHIVPKEFLQLSKSYDMKLFDSPQFLKSPRVW